MPKIAQPTMRTKALLNFIVERHNIHRSKRRGEPRPWTDDPILQSYRFCNVYRELDTVTQWIAEHWRGPHSDDSDLWFAMVVARLVNWPESLAELGYPVPWEPGHFVSVLNERKQQKLKVFTGAYTTPAGAKGVSKPVHIVNKILNPMWRDRKSLRQIALETLARAHRRLMECTGIGSFLAGQVIADLKYVGPLRDAPDWWSWAAPGPGSERGLNRVLRRPVNQSWEASDWLRELHEVYDSVEYYFMSEGMDEMHAQDLQNCLCEWDKFERVRLGEGTPRNRYRGGAD